MAVNYTMTVNGRELPLSEEEKQCACALQAFGCCCCLCTACLSWIPLCCYCCKMNRKYARSQAYADDEAITAIALANALGRANRNAEASGSSSGTVVGGIVVDTAHEGGSSGELDEPPLTQTPPPVEEAAASEGGGGGGGGGGDAIADGDGDGRAGQTSQTVQLAGDAVPQRFNAEKNSNDGRYTDAEDADDVMSPAEGGPAAFPPPTTGDVCASAPEQQKATSSDGFDGVVVASSAAEKDTAVSEGVASDSHS